MCKPSGRPETLQNKFRVIENGGKRESEKNPNILCQHKRDSSQKFSEQELEWQQALLEIKDLQGLTYECATQIKHILCLVVYEPEQIQVQ